MRDARPSRLGGLWALLVGGAAIAALLVFLHPILDPSACPNAGAAGNASAFADPAWDLYFPLVLLCWIVSIAVEQALPVTWRHRTRAETALRATAALALSVTASCCLGLQVAVACH
ncbi:hypothetical protein [Dactylosporangium sp. CA-092794]|uniref:hypothetical protein n=1 Tax=Dactylosporangium sp. CA-092794 TaxID=3239929 RepID=UPI003D90CB37